MPQLDGEAFGNTLGKGAIHAYSSSLQPSGVVNEQAIYFMKDIGYDLAAHTPKSLNDIPQITYDYVVTMGCSDECPSMSVNYRGDWNIPDPKNMEMDSFNKVRDTIKGNVVRLIEETKVNNYDRS